METAARPRTAKRPPPIRPVLTRPEAFLAVEEPTMAQAVDRLAAAVEAHTEMARPAHEVVAGFGDRLDVLCTFLKKWSLPFLASVPGVLVTIGALSPNAAAALKAILQAMGAG